MLKLFFAIFLCFLAVSCAPKKKPAAKAPVDFVSQTLGEAAEQAHSDLAMLAKLRGQGVQPLLPQDDEVHASRLLSGYGNML